MNIGVRAARATDGTIIITAAWCPDCRDEVMPHDSGRCNRCRLLIVDERTLSAREMCKQIASSGAPAHASGEGGNQSVGQVKARQERPRTVPPVRALERLLVDAGDLLDAIAVASVGRRQ